MVQSTPAPADTQKTRFDVEHRFHTKDLTLALLVGAVVLVTRLPFIGAGFGEHGDARLMATVARSIALTGEYQASRVPGYPVVEWFFSWIWQGGPWALNGLTALMSAIAAGMFFLVLRLLGCKDSFIASLALLFIPTVYINSVTSVDFIWTLAFILGSLLAILMKRPVVGGLLFGLAIGCRITSGAMLIPLGMILIARMENRRSLLPYLLSAGGVALLSYTPSFVTYGWGFLGYEPYAVSLESMIKAATVEIWGIPGFVGLLIALVSMLWLLLSREISTSSLKLSRALVIASIVAVAIYIVSFVRMPIKGAYLIIILPFALLLLAHIVPRKIFLFFCCLQLVSPFVFSFTRSSSDAEYYSDLTYRAEISGKPIYIDPLNGPIILDHLQREDALEYTSRVVQKSEGLETRALVICGWIWMPYIRSHYMNESNHQILEELFAHEKVRLFTPFRIGNVEYHNLLTSEQIEQYERWGFTMYSLSGATEATWYEHAINLTDHGVTSYVPRKGGVRMP